MKKIIDDIMREAGAEADKIIASARSDAQETLAAAESECAAVEKREDEALKSELDRLSKRRASARASKQRNRLLEVKHEILEGEIDKAYKAAYESAGDNVLKELLKNRLHEGECVIYFPKDKMPSAALQAEIKSLAAARSCDHKLSCGREGVKSGFVLVYGGIEENCTFEALFAEHRGEITNAAAKLLFGTEG